LISELTYDPENARKHGDADLEAICKSLKKFKQQSPIVVTPSGMVAKGNGTMMAAQKLGWTHIDTVVTYLTGDELTAYKIADNQTALLSEWDGERLSEQLSLLTEDLVVGFTGEQVLQLTGNLEEFTPEEVYDDLTELNNDDVQGIKLNVWFDTEQDRADFFKLIGRTYSDRTKSIRFPQREDVSYTKYEVVVDGSPEVSDLCDQQGTMGEPVDGQGTGEAQA